MDYNLLPVITKVLEISALVFLAMIGVHFADRWTPLSTPPRFGWYVNGAMLIAGAFMFSSIVLVVAERVYRRK